MHINLGQHLHLALFEVFLFTFGVQIPNSLVGSKPSRPTADHRDANSLVQGGVLRAFLFLILGVGHRIPIQNVILLVNQGTLLGDVL